jgi:glycosyltransferase involved in cell wall biosynthesis
VSSASAVIPAYNEEDCIERCLETLLDQTRPPHEVIVVDDGSTDRTQQIVEGLGVRLLHQSHRGPGAARNLGASRATGDILVFVDADMTFHREFLDYLTRPIREGKAVGTFTREEYVRNTDNRWARLWTLNDYLPPGRRVHPDSPNEDRVFRAIRRDAFLRVGGFEERSGASNDDWSLAPKLGQLATAAAGAICYHDNPSTPGEVFLCARWLGRTGLYHGAPMALGHVAPWRTLRQGRRLWRGSHDPASWLFRVIYDLGLLAGHVDHAYFHRGQAK